MSDIIDVDREKTEKNEPDHSLDPSLDKDDSDDLNQIEIRLNKTDLRYPPTCTAERLGNSDDGGHSLKSDLSKINYIHSERSKSVKSVHFNDQIPVIELEGPSVPPSVQPSVCDLDGELERVDSTSSLPNTGYFYEYTGFNFRRPTMPSISLSLGSFESLREKIGVGKLSIRRSILSYCQSIW